METALSALWMPPGNHGNQVLRFRKWSASGETAGRRWGAEPYPPIKNRFPWPGNKPLLPFGARYHIIYACHCVPKGETVLWNRRILRRNGRPALPAGNVWQKEREGELLPAAKRLSSWRRLCFSPRLAAQPPPQAQVLCNPLHLASKVVGQRASLWTPFRAAS